MKFLMCRPDFYGIEYEINPWMSLNKNADRELAIKQWEHLVETMKKCGAEIQLIEPIKGWPDMVFTANAGLYYHNQIVLPHFKYPERQGELTYFETWFKKNGFNIVNEIINDSPFFEGAGDALLAGEKLFVGFGFRSDKSFYENAAFLDKESTIYCELSNPYFYHLDTCFCPLNAELGIWFPSAFTHKAQEEMANYIKLLPIIEKEAKYFACNAVVIDKNVIIPIGCTELKNTLEQNGFEVHECNMSEFIKAGGASKCLTLRID